MIKNFHLEKIIKKSLHVGKIMFLENCQDIYQAFEN